MGNESNTTASFIGSVFSELATISVDYEYFRQFDYGLKPFYLWSTIFAVFGSTTCLALNAYLIFCLFTVVDLKNLFFFPVGVQAAIDAIGPGLANIVYLCLSTRQMRVNLPDPEDYEDYRSYISHSTIQFDVILYSHIGCVLTFLRSILNEYGTGVCVLASAFIRYCLVCHPTTNILTELRMKLLCVTLTVVILVPLFVNTWLMLVNTPRTVLFLMIEGGFSKKDNFLRNCCTFNLRSIHEDPSLILSLVLCLGIPAIVTGVFYIKVAQVLLNRDRDQERNRNLSLAFFLNWFLWIACWGVYFAVLSATHQSGTWGMREARKDSRKSNWENRLITVKENICFLYSHLNPLLFILVLKPFQIKLKMILNWCFKSHKDGFGLIETKQINKPNPKEKAMAKTTGRNKENWKKLLRKVFSVLILLSTLLASFNFLIGAKTELITRENTQAIVVASFSREYFRKPQMINIMRYHQVFPNGFSDPRETCTSNAAFSTFHMKVKMTSEVRMT